MQTPKEIFLELLQPDGHPERILKQYEALHMCLNDPINTYLRGNRRRGTVSRDRWGTTISFPEDAPGAIPVHTDDLTVCPDVTRWEETVHAPDLAANCTRGWEACRTAARSAVGEEKLLAGFMGTGIFEQCHFLMGFENTLTALYEHPEEMHRLIDYITDYRLGYVKLLIDNLHPDVIFSHDDWGTKDALFMHPDMWREFFKEPYRRFYGYIRSRGCIAVHHADSYLAPIVDDMAEIGIQVWQGVLPENDIPALQRHLGGKLVLMGGIGAAIDRADATPEEIRSYTEDTLCACAPGGHFIPSITYGLPGAVYPHIDRYIDETIDAYNARLHLPTFNLPQFCPAKSKNGCPKGRDGGRRHSFRLGRSSQAGPAEEGAGSYGAGPFPGHRCPSHPLRRIDPGHERAGGGFFRQPGLCAGDAHGGPMHGRRHSAAEAPYGGRSRRPADHRLGLHRYRPGRHARHRKKPGENHAGGQQYPGV